MSHCIMIDPSLPPAGVFDLVLALALIEEMEKLPAEMRMRVKEAIEEIHIEKDDAGNDDDDDASLDASGHQPCANVSVTL